MSSIEARSAQPSRPSLTTDSSSPSDKRPKRARRPPAFWDNLSHVPLISGVLKELDRRTRQRSIPKDDNPPRLKLQGVSNLKRFARHGGPDLSDLRAYPQPSRSTSQTMSSGQTRKRKKGATEESASQSAFSTIRSRKTSTYDAAFDQNLIDHGIFPAGYGDKRKPDNFKSIQTRLKWRRSSLSSSNFGEEAHDHFQRCNDGARTEEDVKATVVPIIAGNSDILGLRNVEFNNLAPLTDGNLVTNKPDYYEGSQPLDLHPQLRSQLGKYLVPSTDTTRPCLPNSFLEVKGRKGTFEVLKRQACYHGAIGARAMHELRSYADSATALDGNAYTISWALDSGSGILVSYATHPIASNGSESQNNFVDYHTIQLRCFALTDDPDSFRQGASAFRNSRDLMQEFRRAHADAANKKVRADLSVGPQPSEPGTELAPAPSTVELSRSSETPDDSIKEVSPRRFS